MRLYIGLPTYPREGVLSLLDCRRSRIKLIPHRLPIEAVEKQLDKVLTPWLLHLPNLFVILYLLLHVILYGDILPLKWYGPHSWDRMERFSVRERGRWLSLFMMSPSILKGPEEVLMALLPFPPSFLYRRLDL
jgi:hypothetical protein